jgi:hypothetical protein
VHVLLLALCEVVEEGDLGVAGGGGAGLRHLQQATQAVGRESGSSRSDRGQPKQQPRPANTTIDMHAATTQQREAHMLPHLLPQFVHGPVAAVLVVHPVRVIPNRYQILCVRNDLHMRVLLM